MISIILIPPDDDPVGILRIGAADSRPPTVYEAWSERGSYWTTSSASSHESARAWPHKPHRKALVLAYKGEPHLDGIFVADRSLSNGGPQWCRVFLSWIELILAGDEDADLWLNRVLSTLGQVEVVRA